MINMLHTISPRIVTKIVLATILFTFIATPLSVHADIPACSGIEKVEDISLCEEKVYQRYGIAFLGAGSGTNAACNALGASTTAPAANNLKGFIDAYGQAAFNVGKQYGIPYEAIIAQAAIESGYGKSGLTQNAFNFFGIKKGSGWTGPVYTVPTKEEVNGKLITVTASFRAYPNAEEGFRGYGEFITKNPRYSNALNFQTDPIAYITEIKKAGYATDSSYVAKNVTLINSAKEYIKSNNLFPPSSEVTFDKEPPTIGAQDAASSCSSSAAKDGESGTSSSPNIEIAKSVFKEKGFGEPGGNEFQCLVQLWQRESGWNEKADNPKSSAYGIPQALPGSKMASSGPDWKTNPRTQIDWGLNYIKDRYETPCKALSHSDSHGWY
jgi:hypothetical protein